MTGKTGIKYSGVLQAGEDTVFKSNLKVLKNPEKPLHDILVEEQGMVTLDSRFRPIDISVISDDYGYVGNKQNCAAFINKTLACKPQDIYVDRTIRKEYKISDIPDAVFVPGHWNVEYNK